MAVITAAQLRAHSTREDLWLAVHGQVYNLTAFAVDHPGGIDVLVETAGTDATETYDYAGHSEGALQTMQAYAVGPLEGSELGKKGRGSSIAAAAMSSMPSLSARTKGSLQSALSPGWALVVVLPLLGMAALLVGLSSRERGEVAGDEGMQVGGIGSVTSFLTGLGLASSVSVAALMVVYSRFHETLKMEKEVFAYPPTIPRRVPRSMIDA
ncbi:Cytochrome b5 isoform B [Lasiodiplodia hormozganensis]|uniref:Cytochrome b5 isoform B n=1 Tax=Lasiodiplodia hormozganensis TaxID=869390 RepID=A0AA39Y969_9PEZI|nr:Cytochrome b5 isoform B [Lasiodiplodia hormozganensis]